MTGECEPLSPSTKKARLLEIMEYLSDPPGVTEALDNIPPDLDDYLDLGVMSMDLED